MKIQTLSGIRVEGFNAPPNLRFNLRAGLLITGVCVIFLLEILAVSCSQDPIFFTISNEIAPRPPRVEGAPTNMVVFEREYTLNPYDPENPYLVDPDDPDNHTIRVPILYVASGKLHWYAPASGSGKPQWDLKEYPIPQPGGKIIALAAAGERLYALSLDSHNSVNATLRYIGYQDNEWTKVKLGSDSYTAIQSIYADTDRLFAGARKGDSTYALLYVDDDTDTLKILKPDTDLLSGTVCREGIHYLCTQGKGIFQVAEGDFANNNNDIPVTQLNNLSADEKDLIFMSMIKLKDESIIAIERKGGGLYTVQSGSFKQMENASANNIATGKYATGAIALWENVNNPDEKLLIVGILGGLYTTSTSSYTHGYVEFELNPNGSFNFNSTPTRRDPGHLLSVSNQERYTASIGKRPINYLFQTPPEIDPSMTFFASTQTSGLWSYRNRPKNGGWQWNAEE
ncbi:MAG: hypothetical protein LBH20_08370 [Treponema sp.]|jgi:hypothetical protein|nr:hypothetical protein [Treponema sp.]